MWEHEKWLKPPTSNTCMDLSSKNQQQAEDGKPTSEAVGHEFCECNLANDGNRSGANNCQLPAATAPHKWCHGSSPRTSPRNRFNYQTQRPAICKPGAVHGQMGPQRGDRLIFAAILSVTRGFFIHKWILGAKLMVKNAC